MYVDSYLSAIYWRIAAIFSTIVALFSAGVVLWFLIFRDNPNLPDETDSEEKLRFINDIDKEKHNLLSEIMASFSNFPALNASPKYKNRPKDNSQNVFQRLIYTFLGSSDDDDECASDTNIKKQDSTANVYFVDEKKYKEYKNQTNRKLKEHKGKKNKESLSEVLQKDKRFKFFDRFRGKSKNKNKNNNNNHCNCTECINDF